MRGEWRFPSTHPRYRRVVLRADGAARIDDAAPGVAEFPRIDPRRVGQRHHKVFALHGPTAGGAARPDAATGPAEWVLRRIARLDPDGGVIDHWPYPPHQLPEEHVFVPRGSAEGDGWLLGPFLDVARQQAGLRVFDARRLADGPLWEGTLPYPLPLALHGTFVET